jgi:hypothetical protein
MKTISTVHYRVSRKDKKKGLLIWAFVLFLGAMTIKGQLDVAYMDVVHAQEPPVVIQDRLGEVLDPKGVIYIKEGKDPAWGKIKEPKTIKARITKYAPRDSCHYPAPNGGCYVANWPKIATAGDMACPKEYKFGTKVEYNGTIYTCNDRTANWVQDKWVEPTFDIFVETSAEAKGRVFSNVTIYPN